MVAGGAMAGGAVAGGGMEEVGMAVSEAVEFLEEGVARHQEWLEGEVVEVGLEVAE